MRGCVDAHRGRDPLGGGHGGAVPEGERTVIPVGVTGSEPQYPFLDGNGRTGRLVTNLILIRRGYPPAIIRRTERDRYLWALRKADDGDVGPLGELLARAVLGTLHRFIVPAVAGPYRLVPLISPADGTITAGVLRGAAERGRLKAHQDADGRWMSSAKWVEEYDELLLQTSRRISCLRRTWFLSPRDSAPCLCRVA